MATFVLVHGAWHGGWCYARVAKKLRAAGRIRTLFYLDAFLPEDGQCLFDFLPPEQVAQFLGGAKAAGGRMPPIPAAAFNVNAADAAWVDRICLPQSIATFAEGVKLTGKEKTVKNRTYVLATGYDMHVFDQFHTKVKDNAAWKIATVPCGHDVMLDKPDEPSTLLRAEVNR